MKHTIRNWFLLAVFFTLLSVVAWESVACGDFLNAPKTAGSHGLKDIIEGASGMKPGPAGEFFGWKGGHVTNGAADFTKDQLTKKWFTKEVLEQMADAYEAIAKQASGKGNFNPSAPSRAAQLRELIEELF